MGWGEGGATKGVLLPLRMYGLLVAGRRDNAIDFPHTADVHERQKMLAGSVENHIIHTLLFSISDGPSDSSVTVSPIRIGKSKLKQCLHNMISLYCGCLHDVFCCTFLLTSSA